MREYIIFLPFAFRYDKRLCAFGSPPKGDIFKADVVQVADAVGIFVRIENQVSRVSGVIQVYPHFAHAGRDVAYS